MPAPDVKETSQHTKGTTGPVPANTSGGSPLEKVAASPAEEGNNVSTGTSSTLVDDDDNGRNTSQMDAESIAAMVGQEEIDSGTKPVKRSRWAAGAKATRQGASRQRTALGRPNCKMFRFSVYETVARFYVVGSDLTDDQFRVLKIDRTADSGDLSLAEDASVYTKKEISQLISTIDEGNKSSGGLHLRCTTWGLLGFIRFTGPYYMLLITKRSQVAMIGGHYVYQVDGTELIPLTMPSTSRFKSDQHPEEARFLTTLHNLDLSRSFYFSYSYDVTRTLQCNLIRTRQGRHGEDSDLRTRGFNDMFVWNHHLLRPALETLKNACDWCLPIIHGSVDQATLSVYGRVVYISIIARRSRFFAGARFLKRGANDLGYVANDVETEQIVSEMMTTSFHAPGPKLFSNWKYTAFVQHRGSIPLFWTQEATGVTPKPPIELNLLDPFYEAAALHFDNLFERYGAPVYVLNLIKARERTPRESKLLEEFTNAITYLNQFLPEEKKILYKAWDMSRASKSRDQDVIGTLESIAEEVVGTTGFFQNGDGCTTKPRVQQGVARTNCIDCLDRTNAAQFVIGKRALAHQLHALGVINNTSLDYDTDAVNLFTHMYHDHGDTLAIQYGGSHLVNTMETYRKINQWTSHSRDMVESFKRYYHNSFLDGQRQEAYNLFLGNYIFTQGQPMLWDLSTDYYLHHSDPRMILGKPRRSYINWFTPEYLQQQALPPIPECQGVRTDASPGVSDDYWLEYYRPLAVSSLVKMFSFKMNSTLKYNSLKQRQEDPADPSPFRVRSAGNENTGRRKVKKDVTIVDPSEDQSDDVLSQKSRSTPPETYLATKVESRPQSSEKKYLEDQQPPSREKPKIVYTDMDASADFIPADKTKIAHWTLDEFITNSLNPSVTRSEAEEYQRYVTHPLNFPLVSTTTTAAEFSSSSSSSPATTLEFLQYLNNSAMTTNTTPDATTATATATITEEDLADYLDFLTVLDNPLTVTAADAPKKRYKAYRQWLKGKSLFKTTAAEDRYTV